MKESRPVVQVVFQLRLLAAIALSRRPGHDPSVIAPALIWLSGTMCVYIYNGLTGVVEDRINSSTRPLARGELSVAEARAVTIACGALALLGAAAAEPLLLVPVVVCLALGIAYSSPRIALKRWSGGVTAVAVLGGLATFAAGCIASGHITAEVVVFAVLMSAWMGLVGGLTKDLPDAEGDRAARRRTIAVTRDDRTARRWTALAAAAVGVVALAATARWSPALIPIGAVILAGGLAVTASVLSRHSVGDRGRRLRPYKLFMTTQYAAHLALIPILLLGYR